MNQKFFIYIIFPLFFSCHRLEPEKKAHSLPIAATIGNDTITLPEIDRVINSQLYETLFKVYYIRNIALDEYLADKLILREATSRGLTKEMLVSLQENAKLNEQNLENFVKENKLEFGIPDPSRPGKILAINSKEGQDFLVEVFKQKIKEDLVDSLKAKYNVRTFLSPPSPPKINLDNILINYRGNVNSSHSIIFVSDFECSSCHQYNSLFEGIYNEFKEKMKFGYTHLSQTVSFPILLSECASKQGRFWAFHDSIFASNPKDSAEYLSLAKKIGIEENSLRNCIDDKTLREEIDNSIKSLNQLQITTTPSVIINGKIYYGQLTRKDLSDYISQELAQDKNYH